MLTKDIVKEIKAVKKRDLFNSNLNKILSMKNNPLGHSFTQAVTDAIVETMPHLGPILVLSPINNNTANAVASKLE